MINSEILLQTAAQLRASTPELVAMGMLKEAGFKDEEARALVAQETMEKVACSSLVDKGFDPEEAVKLVKAANVDIKSLESVTLESYEEFLAETLEKAANYIAELEHKLETAGQVKEASHVIEEQVEEPALLPDAITRLATSGAFTNDDLEAMLSMPSETLTKVAAAMDEPYSMGKAAGVARPVTDPLLEFILS